MSGGVAYQGEISGAVSCHACTHTHPAAFRCTACTPAGCTPPPPRPPTAPGMQLSCSRSACSTHRTVANRCGFCVDANGHIVTQCLPFAASAYTGSSQVRASSAAQWVLPAASSSISADTAQLMALQLALLDAAAAQLLLQPPRAPPAPPPAGPY